MTPYLMKRILTFVAAIWLAVAATAQEGGTKTLSLSGQMTPEDFHSQIYEQTTLLKNGQTAAAFTAEAYAGDSIAPANLKGKVVQLCFWGTWCAPCLKELKAEHLPAIVRPYFDHEDYVFIAVAQDGRQALDKFFDSEKGKEYAWLKDYTCLDAERKIFGLFAERGVPRSVIIDRNGKVFATSVGNTDYALALIASALETLLKK